MVDLDSKLGSVVLAGAPILAAVIDPQFRLVWTNQRFDEAFGPQAGQPCYTALKGAAQVCESCCVQRAYREGTLCSARESARSADGAEMTLDVQATPLPGDDGQVGHVALLASDATALVEAQRQLQQSERLATVGLTAAGLAHTIKNILGGMEGAIYTVNSGLEKDDRGRIDAGWEMVQEYNEQVSALVWNLLNYTREQESRLEATDPAQLVADVVALFESKAGLVGIVVLGQAEPVLPPVWMDPQVMNACLSNLVTNAMDACLWDPKDLQEHHVAVGARPRDGGGVVFEVTDDGTGISEENQAKILEAFFTTKGVRGTGLGLLLTRKAVESHGGTIEFTSTPGEGTTFRISLPEGQAPSTTG